MRPRPPVLLGGLAGKLGDIASVIEDPYAAYELRMASFAVLLAVQDYERGPARRLDEIESVSALLQRGADIAPSELSATLRQAASAEVPTTMSGLDERLDTVNGALVELHAWLEDGDRDAELLRDVWIELRAQVRRRGA